jgi:hypothetical protein
VPPQPSCISRIIKTSHCREKQIRVPVAGNAQPLFVPSSFSAQYLGVTAAGEVETKSGMESVKYPAVPSSRFVTSNSR